MAYQTTNPDTGRKRKGNGKKHLIEEIENVISSGSLSKNLLIVLVSLKHLYFHQKLEAKSKLSDTEFNKFVELMEKVKAGV